MIRMTTLIVFALLSTAPAADADRSETLRAAARAGDAAKVRALLDGGVPADFPLTRHGQTALMLAGEGGREEVVRLLLDRGADINARESFFGSTALTGALRGGHFGLARMLLERGASQAAEALAVAIEKDRADLARVALATGRIRALDLKAAARLARERSRSEIGRLIEEAGPSRVERRVIDVAPETLERYAGRYRNEAGEEAIVTLRGKKLVLNGLGAPGGEGLVFEPVGERLFETPAGEAAIEFDGRAGLVEWAMLNRDGALMPLSPVVADPQPLPAAAKPPTGSEVAPRGTPRPWPRFRGLDGSGTGDGQGAPILWDVTRGENIRFRTPIPGVALSSPILWGDRIYVTSAVSASGDRTFRTGLYGDPSSVDDSSEHSFRLYALDSKSGGIVWEREVARTVPTVKRHLKSSLANATPATDGSRIVVLFGAVGVLAAFDPQGALLWRRDVGVLDCNDPQSGSAEWGHASSPVLYGDLVLIQADRRKDSFVAAYRLDSGEPVWRVERDETSTWATPGILPASTGDELVTNGRLVRAYNPRTGELLWTLGPNSEVIVATPVVGEGSVFITAGYPPVRPIYAVRAGRRGDLSLPKGTSSSDAVAWSHARGGTYIPTPILYRGHLYLINNNGVLSCYKADTGEQVYQTRLGQVGASFSASPVAADGRLYFTAETGEVYVLRAGAGFELLATNMLNETALATPAISDGLMVFRTLGHLVGVAVAPSGSGG